MKKSVSIFLVFTMLVVIACFTNASAFGVTAAYWEERPLELSPGETIETGLGLQNMVGGEDIAITAEITSGSEIAEITSGSEYLIPFGSQNAVGITIKITIPETAQIGEEYTVGVTLTTITPGEQGAVAIGSSIEKNFPVIIKAATTETTEEKVTLPVWSIVLIMIAGIVVILVIILLLKKKKRKKK